MDCEKCPVSEECRSAKGEYSLSICKEDREAFRKALHKFCPLEMAVELSVSGLANEFVRYLKGKQRFEGEK